MKCGSRARECSISGLNFVLNEDTCAAFYRNLVGEDLRSGYAVLSAVGDEVVATLLGIRRGSRYVMVRISNAGEKWSNCSPGRLIIERTTAALHRAASGASISASASMPTSAALAWRRYRSPISPRR